MPHPFFDAAVYPWDRAYGREFHTLLWQGNSAFGMTNAIYLACGGTGLPPLMNDAPDAVWRAILNNLCKGGRLRAFFDQFEGQGYPRSVPLQEQMKAIRLLVHTEEQKVFSDGRKVVLDRQELRAKLAELRKEESSTRVLLVRGEPDSGKSHSVVLFEAMAKDEDAPCFHFYAGAIFTLQEVLYDLFGILNATDKIPPADTTNPAWDKLVCSTLLGLANKKTKLWIAVDDLGMDPDGAPLMDGKIRQFFETLAAQMFNPPYRDTFRLMLIHYPSGGVPTQWREEVWDEDVPREDKVQVKEVEDCIYAWSRKENIIVPETHAKQLAADIIAKADAPEAGDTRPRLKRIHDLVVEKLRNLKGDLE